MVLAQWSSRSRARAMASQVIARLQWGERLAGSFCDFDFY